MHRTNANPAPQRDGAEQTPDFAGAFFPGGAELRPDGAAPLSATAAVSAEHNVRFPPNPSPRSASPPRAGEGPNGPLATLAEFATSKSFMRKRPAEFTLGRGS